ncbi:conjugal transfer protein TraF [Heliobacterium undosum]|uniref:Conjugal transfer protein TraF n=1 Tax=Heliomicrobium undosum TaxID=121734 RepID=A0A845L3H1_9FIRM|nr:thioredoxin family protein [Heliomicrobium undosum]MZP31177.1 conjugal transfer protein TraF [Heliomicrobium undosum]
MSVKKIRAAFIIAWLALVLVGCSVNNEQLKTGESPTEAETKAAIGKPEKEGTILYFYAPKCPSCQEQAPILEKWQSEHPEAKHIQKLSITQEENRNLAKTFGMNGIPFFVVLDEDGETVYSGKGVRTADQLDELNQRLAE